MFILSIKINTNCALILSTDSNPIQDVTGKLEERKASRESTRLWSLLNVYTVYQPFQKIKIINGPVHKNINFYYQNVCGLNIKLNVLMRNACLSLTMILSACVKLAGIISKCFNVVLFTKILYA